MGERTQKLCISCMSSIPEGVSKCPVCGYDGSQTNPEPYLPIGYRLHDRYVIGRTEDYDGDTATYIAYDWKSSKAVHLKEYLPENGCSRADESCAVIPKTGAEKHYRASLETFNKTYNNLKSIVSKSMIEVSECFQDNNTGYAVIQLFDGISLKEFLKLKNGTLTWKQCKLLLYPVMDVLEEMHRQGIVHRGVSPDTIFINRHGEIKLGGYATPAVRTKGTEYQARLYPGYSANEQYTGTGTQSPSTDVYAIAAVIYRCLTGITPQTAESRKGFDRLLSVAELNTTVPHYVSNAISLAMVVDQDGRTNSIENLRHGLENEPIDNGTFFDLENVDFGDKEEEKTPEVKKKDLVDGGKKPEKERKALKEIIQEPEDISEEEEKLHALVRTIMIVTAAIFGIILAIFLLWNLIISKSLAKPSVPEDTSVFTYDIEVPDYTNLRISSDSFNNQDFVFIIEDMENNEIEEGIVLRQEPGAGTMVSPGTEIILYVSKHLG